MVKVLSFVLILAAAPARAASRKVPPQQIPAIIHTQAAPPPGNYSQARVYDVGRTRIVHTAGQTGSDPAADVVVAGGIGPQTHQALRNIEAVVTAAGGTVDSIAKVTVFIKGMA